MKIKLDENLGLLGKSLLEADGHDVMTIAEQGLSKGWARVGLKGGRTTKETDIHGQRHQ